MEKWCIEEWTKTNLKDVKERSKQEATMVTEILANINVPAPDA